MLDHSNERDPLLMHSGEMVVLRFISPHTQCAHKCLIITMINGYFYSDLVIKLYDRFNILIYQPYGMKLLYYWQSK